MDSQDLNYFTCTLGEAALWKKSPSTPKPNEYQTVLELIDDQGRDIPDEPAIGFADFSHGRGVAAQNGETPATPIHGSVQAAAGPQIVTFRELKQSSHAAATTLSECLGCSRKHEAKGVIGLMCASSLDFVFTWLGLMRLGYTVFLLAPQLEEKAIECLCSTAGADTIFVGRMYHDKVEGLRETLKILDIPSYNDASANPSDGDTSKQAAATYPKTTDVAYLRHTSGTSSGLPKPIYQTHWGAVGILPRLSPTGQRPATFSTTPLYHGGLADCFRAWAAGAMIWFFPEGVAPITGANVVKAVECARRQGAAAALTPRPSAATQVGYFTSVPYVLQMLSDTDDGIRLLQCMNLVGVGGAALPVAVGDKLVGHDVSLVSRMGSAECGFLLSSDRDYANDKEWQFLRPAAGVLSDNVLAFEPRGDGLSELVALPSWPLLAKTNRSNGSYATADLFEPHPSIPNAWRYHSRSDAQIALANGKKFDPSPLEGAILTSLSQHLRDILVFGGGRDYPGALLFPRDSRASESQVIKAVWPSIQELNKDSQSHTRLSKAMLVVVLSETEGNEKTLPKSSKGTIMRRQAEDQYGHLIEKAYKGGGPGGRAHHIVDDDDVASAMAKTFARVLGKELDSSQDLYGQGVDSIACVQIRKAIERDLLPEGSDPLPINITYDCGTIDELVNYVLRIRKQQPSSKDETGHTERDSKPNPGDGADLALMRDLVQQNSDFGDFIFNRRISSDSDDITVILTGATGYLGSHILRALLPDRNISRIYCLVRAQNFEDAHKRVAYALIPSPATLLKAWDEERWSEGRVVCLPAELSRPDFGLAPRILEGLRTRSAVVIHAAWAVNFNLRISSFGQQFAATGNLIRLAADSGSRMYFISSTAAVNNSSSSGSDTIPEEISTDPSVAAPLGYSKSKWVAENICAAAHERYVAKAREGDGLGQATAQPLISVIRVGQLFANNLGHWNLSEAYPLMLSTSSFTGCMPDLGDMPVNWLPVELAAQAVLDIALGPWDDNTTAADNDDQARDGDGNNNGIPVYHVLNPHRQPTWRDMLETIASKGSTWKWIKNNVEPTFETVPPSVWVQRLEACLNGAQDGHLAKGLLTLWKGKYADGAQDPTPPREDGDATTKRPSRPVFDGFLAYWKKKFSGAQDPASPIGDDGEAGSTPTKRLGGPVFELSRTKAASRTVRDIQPLDDERIVNMWRWLNDKSGLCC
ncbi:male sterility protein-domain-containing protein [Apiospora arundinis]